MVAAWMSADTGVGPAMASGSQMWSGNWALLPITPRNRSRAPASSRPWEMPPVRASRLIVSRWNVCPAAKNNVMVPSIRPMSPNFVVKNAFRAAEELFFSSNQWPISMNEQSPTSSQPIMSCSRLSASTMNSIEAVNSDRAA